MSFLKKISGLLIEQEEDEKKPEIKKASSTASQRPEFKSHSSHTLPASNAQIVESSLHQHFDELLSEANKNGFPGNDFYEFYRAKESLSMIPSEDMKYMAAFKPLEIHGLTKEKLVSTASQYNQVIDKEIQEFDATFDKAYNDAVSAKKAQMESKVKEMQDITQKMKQLEGDLKTLNDEIIASESKLMGKKNSFHMAGEAMKAKIESEIANINTYIK